MAETNAAKSARLQAILDAGASSTVIDGQTVTFDLATVRRQLAAVNRAIALEAGDLPARPVAARVVLGHD